MNTNLTWLLESEVLDRIKTRPQYAKPIFVYSSLIGGWSKSSVAALIGLDDHGFHRGDGLFEAIRVCNGKPYLLEQHWSRMLASSQRMNLKLPFSFDELQSTLNFGIQEWCRDFSSEAMLRIFVTRGPGGFSPNPNESLGPQCFIVIMPFQNLDEKIHKQGVRIGKSTIAAKPSFFAQIKSLNYLPNVLMKDEANKRDLDFVIGFDSNGCVTESATENVIILNAKNELCYPSTQNILSGCTMMRLFELVDAKKIYSTRRGVQISEADLLQAKAVMMVGTTLDVLCVQSYESKKYSDMSIAFELRNLILNDQKN